MTMDARTIDSPSPYSRFRGAWVAHPFIPGLEGEVVGASPLYDHSDILLRVMLPDGQVEERAVAATPLLPQLHRWAKEHGISEEAVVGDLAAKGGRLSNLEQLSAVPGPRSHAEMADERQLQVLIDCRRQHARRSLPR